MSKEWDKNKEEKFQKRLAKWGKRIPKLGAILKSLDQLDQDIEQASNRRRELERQYNKNHPNDKRFVDDDE